jgi:rhodanese-related sulfurtransferase
MSEKVGIKELMESADRAVRSVTIDDVSAMLDRADVTVVDIRDVRELERDGMIPGAKSAPRGMLEFWIDSQSPYHKPYFAEDKLFVFYCASGWRSLLATEVAQKMGLNCASMRGGFKEWAASDKPVEERKPKG